MSTHFSANQYDQAFLAQRLQNWEIPKRFKERPSTLEGFTQPISNDRGHILPGIPRSSKSPWGEFVGTWDLQRAPLKTKTIKTNALSSSIQDTAPAPVDKHRPPSPKQEEGQNIARSPTPQQEAVLRTPSPKEHTSPRPQSQDGKCNKTPSPTQLKMAEVPASPAKSLTQEIAM